VLDDKMMIYWAMKESGWEERGGGGMEVVERWEGERDVDGRWRERGGKGEEQVKKMIKP
jgi:hypothetical protein